MGSLCVLAHRSEVGAEQQIREEAETSVVLGENTGLNLWQAYQKQKTNNPPTKSCLFLSYLCEAAIVFICTAQCLEPKASPDLI